MTSEEIHRNYPLTPDVLSDFRKLAKQKPDMTDTDNPDVVEMLAKDYYRSSGKKQAVIVRLEPTVL